jgi:hypothetical protein
MHDLNNKPQHIVLSCRIYPCLLEQLVHNAYDMITAASLVQIRFLAGRDRNTGHVEVFVADQQETYLAD